MIGIDALLAEAKKSMELGSAHPGSLVIVSWKGDMFPLAHVLPMDYMGTPGITLCLLKPYDAPPLTYDDPMVTVDGLVRSMEELMAAKSPSVLNIMEPDGTATRPPKHLEATGMNGILLLRFA